MLDNKLILITGGTGSFGKKFIEMALDRYKPKKLIVYSRDELKQYEMQQRWPDDGQMRYFIGDVRDYHRLKMAMTGVNIVVHAAALKHVSLCEDYPIEAVETNVIGTQNIIDLSLEFGVDSVLTISTDKAANPSCVMGATKYIAERVTIKANNYGIDTKCFCVRFGNVLGALLGSERQRGEPRGHLLRYSNPG